MTPVVKVTIRPSVVNKTEAYTLTASCQILYSFREYFCVFCVLHILLIYSKWNVSQVCIVFKFAHVELHFFSINSEVLVVHVLDAGNSTPSVTADGKTASSSSPLMQIEGLLEALTVADKDGRIVVDRQGESQAKHVLTIYMFLLQAEISTWLLGILRALRALGAVD